MRVPLDWPRADPIETERLILEPLRVEHADEMVSVLEEVSLYTFIGGRPATRDELRRRYAVQAIGHSPDGRQGWLNWILRLPGTDEAIGTVQATLTRPEPGSVPASGSEPGLVAELAWVVGVAFQRRGYAHEAAAAMAGWLRRLGVDTLTAHINPTHDASIAVATRLGMHPTDVVVDGETRWTT